MMGLAGLASLAATRRWWIEDLENVIAALYRSAISTPNRDPDLPDTEAYRQGFGEVIRAVLQAIGSRQDPSQWLAEVRADRYWIIGADPKAVEGASLPRIIGSMSEEGEPRCPPEEE